MVLICGGGNGAHCLAGLASLKSNIESRVLTLYSDEAERWTAKLESGLLITVRNFDGSESLIQTKPSMVTKDPKEAVSGAHYIFIVVPAFAHTSYLDAINPYMGKTPSSLDFQARQDLNLNALTYLETRPSTVQLSRSNLFLGHVDLLSLEKMWRF